VFSSGRSRIRAWKTISIWEKHATNKVSTVSICWEERCLETLGNSFLPLEGVIRETNGWGLLQNIHVGEYKTVRGKGLTLSPKEP
jgi:hypothetical protein